MKNVFATIQPIEDLLNQWKENAKEYYNNLKEERKTKMCENVPITEENLKMVKELSFRDYVWKRVYSDEKIQEILTNIENGTMTIWDINKVQQSINRYNFKKWEAKQTKSDLIMLDRCYNEEQMEKILEREKNIKRLKLINQVEKKAGTIIDAKRLYFGPNTGINGIIVGEIKTVKVETIYAGGYNIQCLHFRVLVK